MSSYTNKHLGMKGEKMAASFLKALGYEILHQNWRHKRLEVDIIARQRDLLVFVEVKTRTNLSFGQPEDFVDERKQELLMEAADAFCHEYLHKGEIRFDILSVSFPGKGIDPQIHHIEDAFYGIGE